jgi:transposase
MTIPYRDEQILRILAANPDGLTTGQILAIAKTQRGNELPDSNITSQRIYALRETKTPKIESSDTAAGRVHKITAAGRELIAELDRNNPTATPIQPATAKKTDEMPVDLARAADSTQPSFTPHAPDIEQALDTDDNQTDPAKPIDVLQQFDLAVAIIREALVAAQAEPVKITDKRAKIDLLEKLENIQLLEPWAVDLIGEIRADIGKLESA